MVPEPPQEPAPTPAPAAPPPAQPAQSDWTEWPLAQGDWTYRAESRGSIASFGPQNMQASFTIRCERDRNQLVLSRAGTTANSGAQMTLRTTSAAQSYPARNSGNYAAISLPATDYMMDRIAFSRGRFAVETTGLPHLAIPIWPEFTRVVEDCR
ncbi:hypothetical protein [Parasphingorhabdus sp.]|uniref:hypothetical protein n=1 Tax=Parasphingorhabdus sp. TaxID=2709688 RepID=UPI002F94D612